MPHGSFPAHTSALGPNRAFLLLIARVGDPHYEARSSSLASSATESFFKKPSSPRRTSVKEGGSRQICGARRVFRHEARGAGMHRRTAGLGAICVKTRARARPTLAASGVPAPHLDAGRVARGQQVVFLGVEGQGVGGAVEAVGVERQHRLHNVVPAHQVVDVHTAIRCARRRGKGGGRGQATHAGGQQRRGTANEGR